MKIAGLTISKLQLIGIVILLLGLIAALILTQRQKIFKSRAEFDAKSALNITETTKPEGENKVPCTDSGSTLNCTTNEKSIHVNFDPNTLDSIKEQLP